jgi:hypothetical protein
MKKLITICVVVGLMLSTTCVSWAVPVVDSPPDAPDWWNTEDTDYVYAWWQNVSGTNVSPPNNETHWASNFLSNTDFTASSGYAGVGVNLGNVYRPDYIKEIYIYIEGLHDGEPGEVPTLGSFDTDGGTFTGSMGGFFDGYDASGLTKWHYVVSGWINPQPEYVNLWLDQVSNQCAIPSTTNIWVGEKCIPEPATIGLLGLGAFSLILRKK